MANFCDKCGKGPAVGNNRSHSNRATRRRFMPNLTKKKVLDMKTGKMETMQVCMKCLKSSVK